MEARKGQAAMEFLMTYGWAILVVLIAIGALAYFGVLSPERFLPEKCVLSSGSGLFCDDHSAAVGSVTMRIKNLLDNNVNVTAITLTLVGESCVTLSPPAGTQITEDNTSDFTVTCASIASGDKVKGDLLVTYFEGTTPPGLTRTTSGQIVTTAT